MKTYKVTTVEEMKANSAVITDLIRKRIARGVIINDELEREIYERQAAEDVYLSGFEYALGL